MRKEWFIRVEDVTEGPYDVSELKRDFRLTPDTLAWRSGMPNWLPIKDIPELKDLIKKPLKPPADLESEEQDSQEVPGPERILELSPDPNYFYYVLMAIALIILIYLYFQYLR